MIDGIPAKVSTASLIILTALFPLLAYSVKYTAQNTPIGTATIREIIIISKVATIDEKADSVSELYVPNKNSMSI